MSETPSTRASLLIRLRNPQDERAWGEFVELYAPLVEAVARRGGLQTADAADLAQEVFGAVARAIETYDVDPTRGSFRGWLATIARNRLIDGLAARRRQATGAGDTAAGRVLAEVPDPGPSPDDSVMIETEYRRQLFRCAAERVQSAFQPGTWAAFWQTAVEDRPVPEVASELGMSVGAVYVARNRVMARLREAVKQLEG